MNVDNLRECIEQSGKLRFRYHTRTDSCENGVARSCQVESDYLVDYEQKTAAGTTKTSFENDIAVVEKTLYQNGKMSRTLLTMGIPDDTPPRTEETEMPEAEYAALFSAKGDLRPVNFDKLTLISGGRQTPNTLSFQVNQGEPPCADGSEETLRQSTAAVSLISEDTMKLTQLSSWRRAGYPQDMTLTVHEMIVHLCPE